jgi:hypothetical protein
MRMTRPAGLVAATLLFCAACASAPSGAAPPQMGTPRDAAADIRAQAGDTVYLVEHQVRPERRQQFEDFVHEVLWPAIQSTAAAEPARGFALQRVRLLLPITPDENGSYTYTFVLDPVVAGESYNVLDLLRARYGEAEGTRHYGMFTETWAGDFTTRRFIQSR